MYVCMLCTYIIFDFIIQNIKYSISLCFMSFNIFLQIAHSCVVAALLRFLARKHWRHFEVDRNPRRWLVKNASHGTTSKESLDSYWLANVLSGFICTAHASFWILGLINYHPMTQHASDHNWGAFGYLQHWFLQECVLILWWNLVRMHQTM